MSYQGELEKAIESLTEEELKHALYEICLIANRAEENQEKLIKQDIFKAINQYVLQKEV